MALTHTHLVRINLPTEFLSSRHAGAHQTKHLRVYERGREQLALPVPRNVRIAGLIVDEANDSEGFSVIDPKLSAMLSVPLPHPLSHLRAEL